METKTCGNGGEPKYRKEISVDIMNGISQREYQVSGQEKEDWPTIPSLSAEQKDSTQDSRGPDPDMCAGKKLSFPGG